jgi:hypothetical protein
MGDLLWLVGLAVAGLASPVGLAIGRRGEVTDGCGVTRGARRARRHVGTRLGIGAICLAFVHDGTSR